MYELVIIGSGATALYLAYQLRKKNIHALVITADAQVGGRIVSLELDSTVIDKCATRYYPRLMPLVAALVNKLRVPTYILPAVPVLTATGEDITQRVLEAHPPEDTPSPELIPLNWAITSSSPNGFADVNRYALETGYTMISNNTNLNFFYHDYPLEGEDEHKFVQGFQHFMEVIYTKLTIPVQFNTKVTNITNIAQGYLLNTVDQEGRCCGIRAKQIVYTGTIPQLSELILPPPLQTRAHTITERFNVNPGVKVFISFDDPWWTDLVKYTGDPLFNQLIYVSSNVLLLYMVGPLTPKLIKQISSGRTGRVITPDEVPELMEEVYRRIPEITQMEIPVQQLRSASSLIVWYSPQALATPVPGPVLGDEVRYQDQFYIVSGDTLDYGQGWVENAFRAVELFLAQGYLNGCSVPDQTYSSFS